MGGCGVVNGLVPCYIDDLFLKGLYLCYMILCVTRWLGLCYYGGNAGLLYLMVSVVILL